MDNFIEIEDVRKTNIGARLLEVKKEVKRIMPTMYVAFW